MANSYYDVTTPYSGAAMPTLEELIAYYTANPFTAPTQPVQQYGEPEMQAETPYTDGLQNVYGDFWRTPYYDLGGGEGGYYQAQLQNGMLDPRTFAYGSGPMDESGNAGLAALAFPLSIYGAGAMFGAGGAGVGTAAGTGAGAAVAGVEGVAGQAAMSAYSSAIAAGASTASAIAAADAAAAVAGSILAAGGAEAVAIQAGLTAGQSALSAVASGVAPEAAKTAAVSSGVQSSLPSLSGAAKTALGGLLSSGSLPQLIGGGISAAGALSSANKYQDAINALSGQQAATGQQRADAITGAGQAGAARFQDYGTAARNEFSNLAQGVSDRYAGVGSRAQGAFSSLGSNLTERYSNIADQAKNMVGEFKPYALSTTLGATDELGNFRLNPRNQAVSDAALGVAQKSYDAAGAFDLDKIREQEYGLMQRIYAPEDEQKRLALEAREIAQGRGNLQSFSDANSTMFTDPNTGQQYRVGANPRDVAFQKGLLSRDLQSFLTADESAMARRGGLINQGGAAMQTPMNYANFGLNLTKTGADLGKTAFDSRLATANLWSGLMGQGAAAYGNALTRGINAATQAGITGTDAYQTLASRGAELGTGAMLSGVKTLNSADAAAIGAKFDAIDNSLKTKFGGETEVLRMMAKIYGSLGGAVSSLGNNSGDAYRNTVQLLMNQGKTLDQATKLLDQALNTADAGGDIGIFPSSGPLTGFDPYDNSMFRNY